MKAAVRKEKKGNKTKIELFFNLNKYISFKRQKGFG